MIPSFQFQLCNDTVTRTIHKDIFGKFNLPTVSNRNPDQNIELLSTTTTTTTTTTATTTTTQATQFQSDHQLLMHQMEFNESEIAISQDCHSIEVETSDEMITAARDDAKKIINYTIIGNGLILIEGPQMDFDDETKDSLNDLRPINGIDFLVTVNSDEEEEEEEVEESKLNVRRECIEMMSKDIEKNLNESDEMNDLGNDANDEDEDKMQSDTETRTAIATIENRSCNKKKNDNNDDDDDDDDDHDDDDGSSSEHELTNLGWLIDLKNLAQWPVDSANTSNKKHSNSNNSHNSLVNGIMNDIDDEENNTVPAISEKDLSEERFKKFTIQVKQSQKNYVERERIYRMDPMEKPPFNYAQIIAMAMMDRGRMTLKDICKWIQEHFAYFRYNKNWNNSIRHNLSLHFCFTKIARDKTEKGKGGYWELSMNANKSEKKRIRNRRKHRDDNSRVFYSHRNRLLQRKNTQNNSTSTATAAATVTSNSRTNVKVSTKNPTRTIPKLSSNTTNDSCNASSASEGSSSICSTNGLNDEIKASASWRTISGINGAHFVQSLQNVVHTGQLSDDLFGDIITNDDMIIINGADLDQSDSEIIAHCHFDKTNGQTTIDSYFADQSLDQETQQHQHHLPDADDSILIESNLSNAILNDSSNETFIESGLDQQPNLITTSITPVTSSVATSVSTSNVIVEPMPYSLSHMDTVIDIEHEFGNLVNMSDPELAVDGFLDW